MARRGGKEKPEAAKSHSVKQLLVSNILQYVGPITHECIKAIQLHYIQMSTLTVANMTVSDNSRRNRLQSVSHDFDKVVVVTEWQGNVILVAVTIVKQARCDLLT